MDDLIKAFQIFRKYSNPYYPTHCEHRKIIICGINPNDVLQNDITRLSELGFFITYEYSEPQFTSYRFGSAGIYRGSCSLQ